MNKLALAFTAASMFGEPVHTQRHSNNVIAGDRSKDCSLLSVRTFFLKDRLYVSWGARHAHSLSAAEHRDLSATFYEYSLRKSRLGRGRPAGVSNRARVSVKDTFVDAHIFVIANRPISATFVNAFVSTIFVVKGESKVFKTR